MQLAIRPEQAAEAGDATSSSSTLVKFHISLNVRDLARSIAFYKVLFDREPAKQFADYAKFELENPPLVLSLEPQPHTAGGSLNHLGFRVASAEALVDLQRRLEAAGLPTTREEGVACCHSTQTKFWISDPDSNNWEIYILEDEGEHCDVPAVPHPFNVPQPEETKPTAWEHQLGTPFPETIPHAAGTVDEILLRGTFNTPLTPVEVKRILEEARRVLRPGGKITVHGLVSNVTIAGEVPKLPGPASAVRFIPTESWPINSLAEAGFAAIQILKFSETPVFKVGELLLRELLIEARKFNLTPFGIRQVVIYRGPAKTFVDDRGNHFHRGQRTSVASDVVEQLRTGSAAADFIFLPPGEA